MRREGPSTALGLAAIVAAAALFIAARVLWHQWQTHADDDRTIPSQEAPGLGDERPK